MNTPFSHLSTTAKRRQQGISLLTIALLLLMIGGALLAGVAYFRAKLPSELASSQKEALSWADKALVGYASVHHRLPCPASTPDGDENCDLSKGWLPAKALDLDATMFAPGTLPMRYMVYRNKTPASGETFSGDLAWHDTGGKNIPVNSFEPVQWDEDSGRYSGRYDFNARNGLDMCETMRLAYSAIKTGGSAAYAHFKNGAVPVNVAYGIAIAGAGDASGNNQPFDGANALSTPEMEAPDKPHGSSYNDYAFVRDVASLMAAFGCQPVAYAVSADYEIDTASGSGISDTGALDGLVDGADDLSAIGSFDTLHISYDRQGVASPMLASVESVAMAVDVIDEVNGLYDDVRASAEETMAFAIVQAVVAGVGVTVSVISVVADAIGIVKAISAAIASLGLHAGAYVAMAAYGIALAASSIAIAVNTAAVVMLAGGAIAAGVVVYRLNGDTDLVNEFCSNLDESIDEDALNEQLEEQKEEARETVEDARTAMNAAENRFNAAKVIVDGCYNGLGTAASQSVLAATTSNTTFTCTSHTYGDTCGFTTLRSSYGKFYGSSRDQLFGKLRDTFNAHQEALKKKEILTQKKDTIIDSMSDEKINSAVDEYKNTINASGELTESQLNILGEKKRVELLAKYQKDLDTVNTDLNDLDTQIPVLEAAMNAAKNEYQIAANALPESINNPSISCTSPEQSGTAQCNTKYQQLCGEAHVYITTFLPPLFCVFLEIDPDLCDEFAYYALWKDYQDKRFLYEKARENYNTIINTTFPSPATCAPGTGSRVVIWNIDDAIAVLRKVDKRGVLQ